MKRPYILLPVWGLCILSASAASAIVLIDGSLNNGNFDDTVPVVIVDEPDPTPDFLLPKPSVWINEGSRTITGPYEDELSSEPWAGPAPTPVTADGSGLPSPDGCNGPDCGVFFKAFSGNMANGPATGHLYQDHPAIPGWTYTLTGWAGAEPNLLLTDAQIAVEFLDGGGNLIPLSGEVVSLLPTLFDVNGQAFNYKQFTASAVAPAGAAEVRARVSMIDGVPNPRGGGQAFVVDDFTLVGVPEPTSIAMAFLYAIGLIGCWRRK
jgi:hypothetical protein